MGKGYWRSNPKEWWRRISGRVDRYDIGTIKFKNYQIDYRIRLEQIKSEKFEFRAGIEDKIVSAMESAIEIEDIATYNFLSAILTDPNRNMDSFSDMKDFSGRARSTPEIKYMIKLLDKHTVTSDLSRMHRNYIKALKQQGAPKSLINKIKGMSDEDFYLGFSLTKNADTAFIYTPESKRKKGEAAFQEIARVQLIDIKDAGLLDAWTYTFGLLEDYFNITV